MNPHDPYFRAVLTALDTLADPTESFAQYCNEDDVVLTEIYIEIPGNERGSFGLVWTQVIGWQWGRVIPDRGLLDHVAPLVLGLVAAPATITTAVRALLAGNLDRLPVTDECPEPVADQLTPELARAVDAGDLDTETAQQLAFYAHA